MAFVNPPASSGRVFEWHWMNGNISQEGNQALDLEWMHRVGIAGFQNFDAALSTPQVVKERLAYMTPEWKDAFHYATNLADQLGMEEAIAGSPGWSESGGPWVTPADGMKKYVWSETAVEGGKPFTGRLAAPPSVTGPFLSIASSEEQPAPLFYADASVVAYRRPASDVSAEELNAKMSASGGDPDFALLSHGDMQKTTGLPVPALGQSSWIQWEFTGAQTIRAISFVTKDPDWTAAFTGVGAPEKTLEASDDGKTFREVATLSGGSAPEHTIALPAVTAKFFRVTVQTASTACGSRLGEGVRSGSILRESADGVQDRKKLELIPGARVNRFEEKAAFTPEEDLYRYATAPVGKEDAIRKADVVDLTGKMKADGELDWTPPPGEWVVVRLGYSLLGITNHPATKEATGLEVDKLDRAAVARYMNMYLDSYKEDGGRGDDGQARHPLRDQRQLGGGLAELDAEDAGAVQKAARV